MSGGFLFVGIFGNGDEDLDDINVALEVFVFVFGVNTFRTTTGEEQDIEMISENEGTRGRGGCRAATITECWTVEGTPVVRKLGLDMLLLL